MRESVNLVQVGDPRIRISQIFTRLDYNKSLIYTTQTELYNESHTIARYKNSYSCHVTVKIMLQKEFKKKC